MTNRERPVIFRVSERGEARKIAGALGQELLRGERVVLRAVGPNAMATATESVTIAIGR